MKRFIFFMGITFLSLIFLATGLMTTIAHARHGTVISPILADSSSEPDAFGYTWVDNDNGGSPVYEWKDITGYGVLVDGLTDDNAVGSFLIGFDFPFYWYMVDHFYIGSNGYISFSSDANYSQDFPPIPSTIQPNDLVVPLACDINFAPPFGDPGACYYYSNYTDTLIVSWLSVPEWNSPHNPNATHTFQLILCAADSSITFQYGEQSGNFQNPDGASQIGIEDLIGSNGLRYMYNLEPYWRIPHDGLAIRIHADPDPNFVFHDVGIAGGMNETSGGVFVRVNEAVTLGAFIKNYGTLPEDNINVNCKVKRGYYQIYNEAVTLSHLDPGEVAWINMPLTVTPDQITVHSVIFRTTLSGDQYFWNNTDTTEMRPYQLPSALGYADTAWEYTSFMGGGSGFANEFEMPEPVIITDIAAIYISDASNPSYFYILPADEEGRPDASNILWGDTVIVPNPGSWYEISISEPINFLAGEKFFIAHLAGGENITHGVDGSWPLSKRSWEYVDSYSPSRDRGEFDIAIRFNAIVGAGEEGYIAGFVRDIDGTTPIEGVLVRALQEGSEIASDYTEPDGSYILPYLAPGYYDMEASIEGYLDQTVIDIEVLAHDTTIVNFQLQPQMQSFDLISPENGSILESAQPTVIWHSTTYPSSNLPIYYKVYWDEDENFASADSSSELLDTAYTFIDSLSRSQPYYWRVLAYDNYAVPRYSNQTWNFYINGFPEETTILAPANGISADSLTYLIWLQVSDPDSFDVVSYSLQVDDESQFTSPEIYQSGIPDSGLIIDEVIAVQLGQLDGFTNLNPDTRYYWRVRCDDLYGGNSNWTDGSNYFIYLYSGQNTGPEPFPLYAPPDNFRQVDFYTYFIWGSSYDPYFYFDYTIQYCLDSLFSGVVISISGLTDTSLAIPTDVLSPSGQILFWCVLAIDDDGLERIGGIPEPEFRRLNILPAGDANGDGLLLSSDVTYLVGYFIGNNPAPDPPLAGDANGDCLLIGGDVTYLVGYFIGAGPSPVRGDCEGPVVMGIEGK